MASALRSTSDVPAYRWPNDVLALSDGEVNERTGRATWRVVAVPAERAPNAAA